MPRIKQLRGTFLHRAFGERLFDNRLWHGDRHGTALGLAIGTFFSVLPMPLQSIPAAFFAAVFRSNIPAALVGCWITNPFTFPLFFYLQLKIGSVLLGRSSLLTQFQEESFLQLLKAAPGVLFLGGAVLGAILGVVVYFVTAFSYDFLVRAIHRSKERHRSAKR